jgi:hypothetical protein
MPKGSRIAPIPYGEQSPFEQRIRLLSETTGLLLSQLGTAAGLSYDALPRWIAETRAGKALPGTYTNRAQLAEFCGVDVAWLNSPEPLAPGTKAPTKGAAPAAVGTLELAEEAADMLTRLDHIPPAKAWGLMRGLRPEKPSVLAFYEEARRKLADK